MAANRGQVALGAALIASLALHLSAFGLAHTIRDWRDAAVTEARATEPTPDPVDDPPPPDEDKFKPGIENGAPAVVTWIGYDEYKEHLAQFGPTDQAAFTSATAKGVPDSMATEQAPPQNTPPQEAKAQASAAPKALSAPQPPAATKIDDPKVGEAAPPAPEVAEASGSTDATAQASESTPKVESIKLPEHASKTTAPPPIEAKTNDPKPAEAPPDAAPADQLIKSQSHDEPARVTPEPKTQETTNESEAQPTTETNQTLSPTSVPTPLPGVAPTPVSTPRGEPVAENAAQSDKDSTATSTKQVPETKWDNGKPLAVKGMELRPYSLQRHILWDSHDVMFGQRLNRGSWEGRVVRNPIVSMRFDRHGRVGEVKLIRPSGFPPLDNMYLKSWMARWTAVDKRLADLGPDELTNPIQIRIVFIDEPDPKTAEKNKESDQGS